MAKKVGYAGPGCFIGLCDELDIDDIGFVYDELQELYVGLVPDKYFGVVGEPGITTMVHEFHEPDISPPGCHDAKQPGGYRKGCNDRAYDARELCDVFSQVYRCIAFLHDERHSGYDDDGQMDCVEPQEPAPYGFPDVVLEVFGFLTVECQPADFP